MEVLFLVSIKWCSSDLNTLKQNMDLDKGGENLLHFDTSSHEPYNILVGDTWTVEKFEGTPHLYIVKII